VVKENFRIRKHSAKPGTKRKQKIKGIN
jgi:hypothetical protein